MNIRNIKFIHLLLLVSLTTVTILLIMIGIILYNKSKEFVEDKARYILNIKVSQATSDIQKQFEDVFQTLEQLRGNRSFLNTLHHLEHSGAPAYEQYLLSKKIDFSLFNLQKDNNFIGSIDVLTRKSQYSSTWPLMGDLLDIFQQVDGIRFVLPGSTYDVFQVDRDRLSDREQRFAMDRLNLSAYLIGRMQNQAIAAPDGMIMIQLDMDALQQIIPYADSMAIQGTEEGLLFQGADIDPDVTDWLRMEGHGPADNIRMNGTYYYIRDIGFFGLRLLFAEKKSDFQVTQLRTIMLISIGILGGCALLSTALVRLFRGREHIKRFGQMSVRDRLVIYFISTIMLPVFLFVVVFYVQLTKFVAGEVQQAYYAAFEKTVHRIELLVKQKEMMLSRLAYDPEVVKYVKWPDEYNRQELDQVILTHKPSVLNQDVFSMYNMDRQLLYSSRNITGSEQSVSVYEAIRSSRKSIYYSAPSDNGSADVSLGMFIFDLDSFANPLGFIMVEMGAVHVADLYSDLKADHSIAFVTDEDGTIISHSDLLKVGLTAETPVSPERLNGFLDRERVTLYFSEKIGDLPWYFISQYDYTSVRKQAQELIYNNIYLLIIIFLLALLFSYIISIRLDGMYRQTKHGDYVVDEVDQLQLSFNRMLEWIEQLVKEKVTADRRELLLQINALQAQIDPYFLQRAFEDLTYFVKEQERRSAVGMISMLSRLFRYAMGKDNPMTTLREEMFYSMAFVKIMNFRHKEKMECIWNIDEAAYDCKLIKMMIQPILEHMIYHRTPSEPGKIKVVISCMREGNFLVITVSDNGPGVSRNQLVEWMEYVNNYKDGITGLNNLSRRIRLHFGDDCGLSMESPTATGMTISLRVPWMTETGENTSRQSKC